MSEEYRIVLPNRSWFFGRGVDDVEDSAHILLEEREGDEAMCGRMMVNGNVTPIRPEGKATCETCLRLWDDTVTELNLQRTQRDLENRNA